ncbi:uncharacterized protein LOC111481040 isoform X2 [Cucurbita maxima]|uniref:Uncharacterized protein LOC111481040 isoform X2 n=1 Tax=Cucurbita maxima TaxID=3661 RepID=A0A6J1IYD4_CUCMA|nr:uncharacterized protein LOC111481040 isoform X2 [Cucurbita maxima]
MPLLPLYFSTTPSVSSSRLGSFMAKIQVDSGLADESIICLSTCSKVQFRGFQEVFEDPEAGSVRHKEHEENGRDELFRILNELKPGDQLSLGAVELKQHFTQPPPRYSEGTLVKRMEELGIGRPSTYASTLKVLQDRNYVLVKSRVLHPEFRGRMGHHPKDGQPVILKIAKAGFTIRHRHTMASLPKNLKPSDIDLDKALKLLSGKDVRRSGRLKSKPKVEEAVDAL